jgi:hypothetical protein
MDIGKSNRFKCYDYFDKGLSTRDPVFKTLGITMHTVHTYRNEWERLKEKQREEKENAPPPPPSTLKPRTTTKPTAVKLPGGESVEPMGEKPARKELVTPPSDEPKETPREGGDIPEEWWDEVNSRPDKTEEPPPEEDVPGEEPPEEQKTSKEAVHPVTLTPPAAAEAKKNGNGAHPPQDITAEGLKVTVFISIKTMALYQIAQSKSSEQLTLGDFLDACAEDFFTGRGQDLGLVQVGGAG